MPWLTPRQQSAPPNKTRYKKNSRTLVTGLEESGAPLDLGAPPDVVSLLMAARHGALDEPVTAEVVPVFDDLVPLLRVLLFRRSAVVVIFRVSETGRRGGEHTR